MTYKIPIPKHSRFLYFFLAKKYKQKLLFLTFSNLCRDFFLPPRAKCKISQQFIMSIARKFEFCMLLSQCLKSKTYRKRENFPLAYSFEPCYTLDVQCYCICLFRLWLTCLIFTHIWSRYVLKNY